MICLFPIRIQQSVSRNGHVTAQTISLPPGRARILASTGVPSPSCCTDRRPGPYREAEHSGPKTVEQPGMWLALLLVDRNGVRRSEHGSALHPWSPTARVNPNLLEPAQNRHFEQLASG